ncbi:MAG: selenide, water dikinase SelD [Spirochaetes bacterium]|nr:selenide, water dikinase SelD [Spirochaetota bacterium]
MGPCDLSVVLKGIALPDDPRVIVGFGTSDDAGVILLDDETALIQTVDFITPLIDDPYEFGRVAACNSLSDVYAMGGTPYSALNIVCFPSDLFGVDVLGEVLRGGTDVCSIAGCRILGGHSVTDKEMKYGLAVTGVVHPRSVIRNRGLCEGDVLLLTKPIGTGIIATAIKAGFAGEEVVGPCVRSMTTLNKKAAELMVDYDVHACTDVTGFGLAGHMGEMLGDDRLSVVLDASAVPLLPGATELAGQGMIPAGRYRNEDYVKDRFSMETGVPREVYDLVFDPQTSGGLLIALPEAQGERLIRSLHDNGISWATIIAGVQKSGTPRILLQRSR